MRSSVVESRPPENAEIRDSKTSYRPGFRIPDLDPQRQSMQSTVHKSLEHQLALTPGEGWLSMLLLAIAVYSVVFSIISANWVGFSYILLFSTAVGLLLGLCIAKIQRFPQAILHLAAVLLGHWLSIWLVSAFAYHSSWLLLLENLRSLQVGAIFTLFILLISLMLPIVSQPTSGANFWNNLDNIWANITHGHFSLSSPGTLLEPYQTPTNFFGDQLSITGNVNLPTGEVLYYTGSSKS